MKETSKEKIRWNLELDATFMADFWVENESVQSSTYDEDNQTIYLITTNSNETPGFYSKQLLTNGSFPHKFNPSTSLLYDGLLNVNGVLFGLSQNNIINELIKDSDALKVSKEVSLKVMINECIE
jgi:hypothetical protein